MTQIRLITNEDDYQQALTRLDTLIVDSILRKKTLCIANR